MARAHGRGASSGGAGADSPRYEGPRRELRVRLYVTFAPAPPKATRVTTARHHCARSTGAPQYKPVPVRMATPAPHKAGFHLPHVNLPHFHLPAFGQRGARPMAAGGDAAATAAPVKLAADFSGRWQKARGGSGARGGGAVA